MATSSASSGPSRPRSLVAGTSEGVDRRITAASHKRMRGGSRILHFTLACALLILKRADAVGWDTAPEERRVTVGGRRLFVSCSGAKSGPVVVLIASGPFSTDVWNRVQGPLSASARVCSFDRAGVGKSDPGPRPQTAEEIVTDIEALLRQAREEPPYVLVGHSAGGLYARIFAARFRGSVAGLVLVDSAHEEQIWRLAAIAPALVDAEYGGAWRDPKVRKDLGFLGDGEILKWETQVPLIVLQQGRALPERPELGLTATAIPQVTALWRSLQKDLASRSPSGELRTAQRSGHFIQTDQPELVVRAVHDVLASVVRPPRGRP
jgi:pimeloyl-ACP methyl ester carboxylesterase